VPLDYAKFYVNKCNESPLWDKNANFQLLRKFNTGSLLPCSNPAGNKALIHKTTAKFLLLALHQNKNLVKNNSYSCSNRLPLNADKTHLIGLWLESQQQLEKINVTDVQFLSANL